MGVINTPFEVGFHQVFQELNFSHSQVFKSKFLKEFLALKISSLFFLKGWKIIEKKILWELI